MAALLLDVPGCAKGVLAHRSPSARIACGAGVFAACMAAPAASLLGDAFLLVTAIGWLLISGLPARLAIRVVGLLALVLLPILLLALVSGREGRTLAEAISAPWALFARGMASTLVTVATFAALAPWELHEGLGGLPLPKALVAVLIQIVRQTGTLARETAAMAAAIRVRGGTSGLRSALAIAVALPRVWLPRVGDRAERTARAMELRGFDGGSPGARTPWTRGDVGLFAATLAWAGLGLAVRVWGGVMTAALDFRALEVRYGDGAPVLDRLDLRIDSGERVALLGLNGSGKTTLLMTIVGLVPCRGTVQVFGETLNAQTVGAIRRKTGMLFNVPEDQILFPRVVDDVAFGPKQRGMPAAEARENALETLASMGIDGVRAAGSVHALSHGQKQRVALAGALVTRPELLLLDEPSAGLDPPGRIALARVLERIDATLVLATHDLEFARQTCRRFILLEGGKVAWDGADLAALERRWKTDDSA